MQRHQILNTGLMCFLAGMVGILVLGQNGLMENHHLKADISQAQARNQRLADRNQRLLKDVVDIKSRIEAVEELARNKLGMIKQGEVFYHVIER